MRLQFTRHALDRMRERGILEEDVRRALLSPDKLEASARTETRLLAKKLIKKEGSLRLLLIIHEVRGLEVTIVTVIDTSKLDKYY